MSATTQPRYVPPGSCAWCAHKPHNDACSNRIRTGTKTDAACPCARHLYPKEVDR